MRWTDVLFAHWPVDPAALARRVPPELTLDLHDESAWVSLVALVVVGPAPGPLLAPGSERVLGYNQINVRTYVKGRHGPGILLLETLVDSRIAAIGASLFGQPYHFASGIEVAARSTSAKVAGPGIELHGPVATGAERPEPSGRESWLLERYWAYGRIPATGYAVRVEHAPWVVRRWEPEGRFPALEPLVGSAAPVAAAAAADVEVAIAEIAREPLAAARPQPATDA